MRRTDEQKAAMKELAKYGATDIQLVTGTSHPRIAFVYQDKARTIIVSGSPSERNACHLVREHVRQALGIVREKRIGHRRQRRRRRHIDHAPPPDRLTVGKDPFAPLYGTDLHRRALQIAADWAWRAFMATHMRAVGHEPVHPALRDA